VELAKYLGCTRVQPQKSGQRTRRGEFIAGLGGTRPWRDCAEPRATLAPCSGPTRHFEKLSVLDRRKLLSTFAAITYWKQA
jgi:hypothetical protein